jgi:hypothetical protein
MIDHANRRKLNRVAVIHRTWRRACTVHDLPGNRRRLSIEGLDPGFKSEGILPGAVVKSTWPSAVASRPVNGDEPDVNFLKDSKVKSEKDIGVGNRQPIRSTFALTRLRQCFAGTIRFASGCLGFTNQGGHHGYGSARNRHPHRKR